MSETILVTGGAGYIGSIAVEKLLELKKAVIVLDNLSTGHKESLFKEAVFYEGSVEDKFLLNKIFSSHKIDAVMHFGAYSIVSESMTNPEKYFQNNFYSAINLLDCMVENGVKNLIFSSTASVYGIPKEIPVTEESRTEPINNYGKSKLLFENILSLYKEKYGLNFIALRYFNVAGGSKLRGEHHYPETHLIPIILKSLGDKSIDFKVAGNDYPTPDGTCMRDYIHVLDLIDGHILALKHMIENKKYSNVYNIGYGHGISVLEVINAINKYLERINSNKKIEFSIGERRIGDPPILIADCKKIINELGWKPKHNSIDEIIESAFLHI